MKRRTARKLKSEIRAHGSVVASSRDAVEEWTGETLRNLLGRKKATGELKSAGFQARPPLKSIGAMEGDIHLCYGATRQIQGRTCLLVGESSRRDLRVALEK